MKNRKDNKPYEGTLAKEKLNAVLRIRRRKVHAERKESSTGKRIYGNKGHTFDFKWYSDIMVIGFNFGGAGDDERIFEILRQRGVIMTLTNAAGC